ncbi:M23 family metallopeptidase [Helicobacter pylori]|uniref:M23 family metallopeptidase n=1 Tax=Helicobacter pylori TaxID=210 RepID=UPI001FD003D2|nr:M23 family metallopeptidase [Helicobacter pylori]UOR22381.1 M23 family metallopeptidase [Helicobacter pylori]
MGFQNENELKIGASVKATINGKVVEAKVIGIGFNRVTLRSEKGNEVSYAFNSEKFLKWFNHTPLNEVAKNHAEKSGEDLLKGVKVVTSGPTIKQRTTTPKEKEDRFKLAFGFKTTDDKTSFEIIAEDYTLSERKIRLGSLLAPMFYEGSGNQAVAIILTALLCAKDLNKHSDAEWRAMIDNRDVEKCDLATFDHLDRVGLTLLCGVIRGYAGGDEEFQKELNDLSPDGFWATTLPKNKNEALFIAQLLCDGGINKYGLSCAGLTENLLKDIFSNIGLASAKEVDEHLANLDKEEAELKE